LRLFIAVACQANPAIRARLEELAAISSDPECGVRVQDENSLHITLRFLGTLAVTAVPAIITVMEKQLADFTAFDVELAGLGSFHNALWMGVKPALQLGELAAGIDLALAAIGMERELQPYLPHLTLARLEKPAAEKVRTWFEQHKTASCGTVQLDTVNLYQSFAAAGSSGYAIIHTVVLSPPAQAVKH